MKTVRFLQISLLLAAALSVPSSFAQDYTRWGLPEGAKARLGKGWLSGNVVFSPDGSLLAVGSSIGVWLYNAHTGAEVNLLTGHTDFVTSVAFSPDGAWLASGSWDTTVQLWDVRAGKHLHTLVGHTDSVNPITFSPDGATLASKSRDGTIRLWDPHTGESVQTLEGHRLGSINNTVRLWDVHTGETAFILEDRQHWLSSIVFISDTSTLGSSGAYKNEVIRLWDVHAGGSVASLEDGRDKIKSVAYSPDGSTLAGAIRERVEDNFVRLWDIRTGEILHTLDGYWLLKPIVVAFSPDGGILASAGRWDSMLRLWDPHTGEHLGSPETFTSNERSIAFSPDGNTLAWSRNQLISIWNVRTGVIERYIQGHPESVSYVAFSPDGSTLAGGSEDGSIRFWDIRTGEHKQILPGHGHWNGVTSVVFSPDGSTLASGGVDKTVRLWDAHTGEHEQTLSGHLDEITSVAFSHDGELLASSSGGPFPWSDNNDDTIRIWAARTGAHLRTLEGHTRGISSVAFVPDGLLLASGSHDNTIRIWDVRTGEHLHTLEGHTDAVSSVAFSPDGNTLVSGSWDGSILLWELRHSTTWGNVKRVAVDSTMYLPGLSPSALTPGETALLANYPNPFNPETWIPYQLGEPAKVVLTIYDMTGQAVRTLALGHKVAGAYRSRNRAAYWDGRNEVGESVANGVYFCTMTAADFTATRKLLVGK